MNSEFFYSFPAIRGIQANREYYVIMCPLKIISKLFVFNELEQLPPEFRAQRIVNENRIPDIADYILNNKRDYVFSSLTASVDGEINYSPINKENKNNGILKISMDSKLLINDGQHRKYAIKEALKADPSFGEETISIVIFVDEGLKRAQQIFSDLNKHAVNVSKSIGILYDSRDEIAKVTRKIINSNKKLHQYTDLEQSSLSKYSPKLFTLSNLYSANKRIIQKNKIDKEIASFIEEFWDKIISEFNDWKHVLIKETSAYHHRSESISTYGVVLEAFGLTGYKLFTDNIEIDNFIDGINRINWRRDNKDWMFRVINHNGRILKNTKSIKLTSNIIKNRIGIELTKKEKALESEFLKERNDEI